MVTIVENERGDRDSNFGRDGFHFTKHLYPWGRYKSKYSPSSYEKIGQLVGQLV